MKARLLALLSISLVASCRVPFCPVPEEKIVELGPMTETSLKMNATDGRDAFISNSVFIPQVVNTGDHKYIVAQSWTNGGDPQTQAILIDFDLSGIPEDAVISSATLHLFADTTRSVNGSPGKGHSQISGSNRTYLSRITTSWDENLVIYLTAPEHDEVGRITIPATTSSSQKYEVDVTQLVRNEHESENLFHGFRIDMVDQDPYRQVIFYSSECEFPELTPELKIKYALPVSP